LEVITSSSRELLDSINELLVEVAAGSLAYLAREGE